jgi:glutamyl-tRNA reductase
VSKALEQIKQEAVGGLKELGKSLGDKLTDGFVGRVLALKDAGEKEVRQWVESVQKLRADALGTLRRGLTAAVDPSKSQALTVLEKAIGDLVTQAFGPVAKRVTRAIGKLTGKVQEIATRAMEKVARTLERIREKAAGVVEDLGRSLAEKLRGDFAEKVESLERTARRPSRRGRTRRRRSSPRQRRRRASS